MNKNTWFYVNVPGVGFYDVCQTVAPTGAKLAVPSCKQVEVEELGLPLFVQPFQSVPL